MKIAVVGGGPAGMTAAIAASENGNVVVLFEKNEKLGKKLYVTGKGRCNLTNASSTQNVINNVVTNQKFLYSALGKFSPEDSMRLIESAGVPLKIERGNRVFPVSDKSSDIIKAFSRLLNERGVEVRLSEGLLRVETEKNRISCLVTERAKYDDFDAVILATGGVSYPATGSTGDGYRFAKQLGHTLVEPKPSLVGFYLRSIKGREEIPFEKFKLQGISLKNVSLSAYVNEKPIDAEFGEALFTDKGISGPIALTLSAKCNRYPARSILLHLDMKPSLSREQLHDRIVRETPENGNREMKNYARGYLLSGLVPLYLTTSGISPEKKLNELSKEERTRFVNSLKDLTFSVSSLEPIERAVVTSGGVAVSEIEAKTMKSKLFDNLYFAGEVIDVDALTGGYNIQIAMSTGYAAGSQLF